MGMIDPKGNQPEALAKLADGSRNDNSQLANDGLFAN